MILYICSDLVKMVTPPMVEPVWCWQLVWHWHTFENYDVQQNQENVQQNLVLVVSKATRER